MKRLVKLIFIFLMVLSLNLKIQADSGREYILFVQETTNGATLNLTEIDGSGTRELRTGRRISVYHSPRHLLYLVDGRLYEYDPELKQERLWARFKDRIIGIQLEAEGPDQAFIVSQSDYELNYHVLDFSDGNIRRAPPRSFSAGFGGNTSTLTINSPDQRYTAELRFSAKRSDLKIKSLKHQWVLPKELTLLPDVPQWSPDSLKLAFYGKAASGYAGFYSLYVLDLSGPELELHQVATDVFPRYFFDGVGSGGFRPAWFGDSRGLLYSYLPYGMPKQSSLLKYNLATKTVQTLYESSGENYYPMPSRDGSKIIFISNRDNEGFRLFLLTDPQKAPRQLSPEKGETVWAELVELRPKKIEN